MKFWAEVEGNNLNITPEKIINLEKKIYKALHKDVRLTPALLLTLTTEGPIASHCNDRSVCFCMPPLHWRTTFADENEKKMSILITCEMTDWKFSSVRFVVQFDVFLPPAGIAPL